ncbi:MAG TPA: 50S ribosomal protein L21 [Proteiniclasticum sp.]|nr:50S ribosomal protein L21 [Proteiniclasticum sp.]
MFAIINTGGKQYKVSEGDLLKVEKITADLDSIVELTDVLAVSSGDGELTLGNPLVEGARVTAKVIAHGKAKKVIVFKFKAKKDYRKKHGHRQPFTKILIEKIEA